MPEVSVLADYGDLCGEGPLWDPRTNTLYWTDIVGKRFYRLNWGTREHQLIQAEFEVAGFAFQETGGFVAINAQGIWQWDGTSAPRLAIAEADGTKCQMNDCVADPRGRLFAGSWFYDPSREDYPLGYLVRVDTDGTAHVVDEGIHLANGLGFSPDRSTLYFSDSVARVVYAYDYRESDGSVANRRVLQRFASEEGLPDGLTVDAEGYIWCALWFGAALVRLDPDGKVERKIETPAKQTSSLAFGGQDWTDMFITTAGLADSVPLAPPGYQPDKVYSGGRLYHVNLDIPGREEYRCRIAFRPAVTV